MRYLLLTIALFAGLYFAVAGLAGPGIIVAFNLGVAEPVSCGWPMARVVCLLAAVATGLFTAGFAAGALAPAPRGQLRPARLLAGGAASAGLALLAVPAAGLVLFLMHLPDGMMLWGVGLAVVGVGVALGRLTRWLS